MSIEDNSGLRVLAINIFGRFLSNRDNNTRYVALNMLMRAITVDTQAVQRHQVTILECVKDSDASIRKRALELVYLLVNESNVKSLTKELIEYLEVSDQDFKGDLTAKICSIVEKFSTEKIWYIDKMLKVLSEENGDGTSRDNSRVVDGETKDFCTKLEISSKKSGIDHCNNE